MSETHWRFTGFVPEGNATPEVREAFRLLAELGMPFWYPGPARGNPLVEGALPTGERGFYWIVFGDLSLEEKVREAAFETACRLLAAYVPLIPEEALPQARATYASTDLSWLREKLLAQARREVAGG